MKLYNDGSYLRMRLYNDGDYLLPVTKEEIAQYTDREEGKRMKNKVVLNVREDPNDDVEVVHILKTWPFSFQAMWNREKRFEIRKDDRHFKVGDGLQLQEYLPYEGVYTGREILCTVDWILPGGQFGLERGYVCMSLGAFSNFNQPL